MSREIKFRAWLPAIKKMTYTHTLDELMNWNTKTEDNGTAIWLQYTGLKDKNGVEIYEGDIITSSNGTFQATGTGIVRTYKGMYVCFYGQDALDRDCYDELHTVCDTREVIGNIYENEELLSQTVI